MFEKTKLMVGDGGEKEIDGFIIDDLFMDLDVRLRREMDLL